jgi:hypothetical protein
MSRSGRLASTRRQVASRATVAPSECSAIPTIDRRSQDKRSKTPTETARPESARFEPLDQATFANSERVMDKTKSKQAAWVAKSAQKIGGAPLLKESNVVPHISKFMSEAPQLDAKTSNQVEAAKRPSPKSRPAVARTFLAMGMFVNGCRSTRPMGLVS